MIQLPQVKQIQALLKNCSTIAVVGLSPKPERPSHRVSRYMLSEGYNIIPVNPGLEEILGQACYPDLLSVPAKIDIVNIFRRAEHVLPIVQAAIKKKAKVIWMQEGIKNQEAATLAQKYEMTVIMDRCIMVDHRQFVHQSDEV